MRGTHAEGERVLPCQTSMELPSPSGCTSPAAVPGLEPGHSIKELKFIYEQVTKLLKLVAPSEANYGLTGSRKLIFLLQM